MAFITTSLPMQSAQSLPSQASTICAQTRAVHAPKQSRATLLKMQDDAKDTDEWKGFGAKPQPKEKSKAQIDREKAAAKYDEMQKQGMPEYSVWIREKGKTEDKDWYPVGSLAVERSGKIDEAIFENEQPLLKGAFRLFPKLQKQGAEFEYGWQIKEFPDEPIKLAVNPADKPNNGIAGFFNKILNPLNLENFKGKGK
eukprot:CAMPEP_0184697354 /NCGR_PEP_ID=MMETSP0313-20130426/4341_1 /TAXON_ID=2792 /ORGANISM="Porphyridium aerugineum, Strain SAG 1380-2" /LENGTH=197 /DNA_ID=CAMNT_0027156135 /DNA_START=89 /DNA_END=682 /DNA_ORIENTATION=-